MNTELSPSMYLIKLIWRYRKFFIYFNAIIVLSAIIISLVLPKWYKADVKVYLEEDKSNGFSMSSMLEGLPFNLGGGSNELLLERNKAIMSSRAFLDKIIEKFNLDSVYESEFKEDTYMALQEHLRFIDNEDGTFTIVAQYEGDPKLAAKLANFAADLLMRKNVELDKISASKTKMYLEKSYLDQKADLYALEDSLKRYQEKTKIYQLEDQVKVGVEQIAEFESKKIEWEIELEYLKTNFKSNYQAIAKLEQQVKTVQNKIIQLKSTNNYSNLPFDRLPEEGMKFLQIYRDVMIGQKILEVLVPQLELAKIEEVKNTASMVIIDRARVPEMRYKPKRAAIVIISTFLGGIISIILLYLYNFYIQNRKQLKDIIQAE